MSLGIVPEKIVTGFMAAEPKLGIRVGQMTFDQKKKNRVKFGFHGTVFAVVGRLIGLKGLMETLRAWKTFTESTDNDDCMLVFIGRGEQKEQLKKFVAEHKLRNVRFLDQIPYDEIHDVYSAFDVMISASLEDNWSLVVPEAMSCGIPVLNSVYNGCWPELTIENETGWVFNPLDQSNYVMALKRCLNRRDDFNEMGRRAMQLAGKYDANNAAKRILNACEIAFDRRKQIRN